MKAMVYNKNDRQFTLSEVEMPEPKTGEVLIRVHASSINAADYRTMKFGLGPTSGIYGADVAGTVVKLGAGVTRLVVGDAVQGDLAMDDFGAYAEYVAAPEVLLAKKPEEVSFEMAAASTLAGGTALQAFRFAGIDLKGKSVLVLGASGGVGTFAVQLAKHYGAEVTGVTSERNLEQTRAIGADHVIDYHKQDALAAGKQYDLILAVHGSDTPTAIRKALRSGGAAIVVGGAVMRVLKLMLFGRLFPVGRKPVRAFMAKPNAEDTEQLMRLVTAGIIRPVIEKIVPFAEIGEAFRYVASGHASGKVVIRIA
jgi:NADPH:quinone reductase-like Zn-dependent oxidoreductase